jgi:hypothetical protein
VVYATFIAISLSLPWKNNDEIADTDAIIN